MISWDLRQQQWIKRELKTKTCSSGFAVLTKTTSTIPKGKCLPLDTESKCLLPLSS